MNPATKNDLNFAVQQVTNTITSKTVSYQDVQNIVQGAAQRNCSKQDAINIFNSMRDMLLERMAATVHEQQGSTRALMAQIETLQQRMVQIEAKLDASRASIQAVQTKVEQAPVYKNETTERAEPTFQRYFDN